ncbi:hypothetical protein B8W66_13220 [Mycobacterium decipiens]|uniref:Uncharacterized protein n=1 Tax=Mycobacterium decipiens TaxID=1430326 RepID=A0A1X2LTQ9_9MYCO|nr:hypothetical protein B8W66_13220 [Mycobacterium decipiens]
MPADSFLAARTSGRSASALHRGAGDSAGATATATRPGSAESRQLKPAAVIHLDGACSAITAEADRLQRMFDALLKKKRKTPTSPAWPRLPQRG